MTDNLDNFSARFSLRASTVFRVIQGEVHVFLARKADAGIGARHHLWTARAGDLLFGCAPIDGYFFFAAETLGTNVAVTSLTSWPPEEALSRSQELKALDRWLAGLLQGVAKLITPRPSVDITLEPSATKQLQRATVIAGSAALTWASGLENAGLYMGTECIGKNSIVPLTPDSWVATLNSVEVQGLETAALLKERTVPKLLENAHDLILRAAITNARLADVDTFDRLQHRAHASSLRRTAVLERLLSVLRDEPSRNTDADQDPLVCACEVLGKELGVRFASNFSDASAQLGIRERVETMARAAGLRLRVVSLPHDWWKLDLGPLLVLRKDDGVPMAAIDQRGRYLLRPTLDARAIRVDAVQATTIATSAMMFYRPLPEDLSSTRGLLRFAMHGSRLEIRSLVLTIVGLGLASCATPLAFGLFAGWLVPTGNFAALWGLLAGLLAFALVAACLQALQGLSWLRIEGRGEGAATAALVDRLLKLPVSFFQTYGSGDLGSRVLSLSALRNVVTAVTLGSLVPALIGLFSILLLVAIDGTFAFVSLVIAGVVLGSAAWIAGRVEDAQSTADAVASSNSNLLTDVVTGIHKLRVTSTEDLFLSRWAKAFSIQRIAQSSADRLDDRYQALGVALPLLVLAAACYLGYLLPMNASGQGRLIAAQFALLQVAFASHALGHSWIKLRRTKPLLNKLIPLLQAPVESRSGAESPGELKGALRLTQVNFSYGPGMPPVVQDLSLTVRAGEFVALVGPSGCGKSTVLRLLLGFETPNRGSVEWDGRNLHRLDIEAFRRQVGTVLQNGVILPGTIRQFIAGPNHLNDDDIWQALRLARIDDEIRRLPMGLQSGLGHNGAGFSGGQRQRLLLARSLAMRPRVLVLDEATSALDNRTQAEVMDTLRQLDCTRIVVAHRLSTIRYADRIITLVGGKLVQSGTYDELVAVPGPFQDLVRRQHLD